MVSALFPKDFSYLRAYGKEGPGVNGTVNCRSGCTDHRYAALVYCLSEGRGRLVSFNGELSHPCLVEVVEDYVMAF